MQTYSLFELNEFIRRILALNLPDALWVRCEIAKVNHSRGHYYFELVEKGKEEEDIIAQLNAVLWSVDYRKLLKQRGPGLNDLLRDGMEVQLFVKADFHERYGLKLIIQDIDPAYTLGKLELKRRETIRELKQRNLLEKNRQLSLPKVLQRIAVLTSGSAAGYRDYLKHLEENEFGYSFDNQLFETAVQGPQMESEMMSRLKIIEREKARFDCVVVIRGGGGRPDLTAFDSLDLCKEIACCPIPVLTGVGHEVDESILDLLAFKALKTPTAVADFLITRNWQFESEMIELGLALKEKSGQIINDHRFRINEINQYIKFQTEKTIHRANDMISYVEKELPQAFSQRLEKENTKLENLEAILRLLAPESALRRGFSITSKGDKVVQSKSEISDGDILTTLFRDGKVKSIVKQTKDG